MIKFKVSNFRLLTLLLAIIACIPECFSVWTTYKQFAGFIPSYTYKVSLNVGDVIRGFLNWPGSSDLDIYLYSDGQDLMSRDLYVTREFSPTTNPEDLIYTIDTAGDYYLRVDLFSTIPTGYKFEIFINDILTQTFHDTVITVTQGQTAQQFSVNGPCNIRVKYDGPIYDIYLFEPGVDVITGVPVASDTSVQNPKYITQALTMGGNWNIMIKHLIYSTTSLAPFKIVVETDAGTDGQCLNFCSGKAYSLGLEPGYADVCLCQTGFTWNSEAGACVIDCLSFNSTGTVVGLLAGTTDKCQCMNPNFSWDTTALQCVLDCTTISMATSLDARGTGCVCSAGYTWDSTTMSCLRDCGSIANTAGISATDPTACACVANYNWDPTNGVCLENMVCGDGYVASTEQCDDGNTADGDGCNADCTIGNNNGCPASTPYIDPLTGSCTATCPSGYFANTTTFTCTACGYTCGTCSSATACDSCSPTSNRYPNGTSCLPSPGFFDNGTQVAPACISPCVQCTSATLCLICIADYFLSAASTCLSCSTVTPFCTQCSTAGTACTNCALGYVLNATTLLCDPVSCTVTACVSCPASNSICEGCAVGYRLTSGACLTVCGDGTKAGTEQCDDGNNVDGDGCNSDCTTGNNNGCLAITPYINPLTGACTATCPSGYFANTSTFTCTVCGYTCGTCSTSSTCDSCSPTSNRYLNGTSCLPSPGFFDNSTLIAPACISPCVQCISMSSCLTCIADYFLSAASVCVPCSTLTPFCTQCDAAGTACSNCALGYVLNPSTLVCDVVPCTVTNCVSCPTSNSICEGCATGFQLLSGNCLTVCGDGTMAGTEQCDDGNNVDGDGCNADCTTGNNNGCLAITPYINPLTGACTATCPSGYFANTATFACTLCGYTCSTCSTSSTCDSCSPTSNRYLNGTSCLPSPGFYDNGTQNTQACVSPCALCSSASACLTCVSGSFLSGSTCSPCSTITPFCTQCDAAGTACSFCQLGYVLNPSTLVCDVVPCNDIRCLACPSSMAVCTTCIAGFQAVNGACQTVCGDFFVAGNEVCDDGNSIDKDGCSSSCAVETDFTCEPDPVTPAGSACFYIGTVSVKEVYISKVDGENKIQIQLDLSPNDLAIWDSVNFLDMIQVQSPVPITGYDVVRNSDGTVTITVSYAADIQGQPMDITVDPTKANLPALSRASPSITNLVITPDDNEGAYFYDSSVYSMAKIVSTICTATSALAGVLYVLALISGKMIGVEMMAVVQISFFSLVTLSQLNPCFAALSSLKLVNGYNSLNHNHMEDQLTPASPKGIFLFSRFTENFNFTVAIILIPLLVALICFILSKTALKENERVQKVAKKAVAEYTLMGLLFGGYMIAVSFGLQIMYGIKKSEDFIGKVSLAECAVLLLLMVGYFVFLLLKPEPEFFGEFVEEFKKDRVSSKYYNCMLVERVLVGSCLVFLLSANIGAVVPMVVFLLTGIFVTVKKPYRENYQNYRVIANISIALVVEAVYLAYTMTAPEKRNAIPVFLYLPFIVCALLVACVVYNGVAIIYGIYKMCKNGNAKEIMEKEEIQEFAKLRKESLFTAPTSLTSPKAAMQNLESSTPITPMQQNMARKKVNLQDLKKSMSFSPEKAGNTKNTALDFTQSKQINFQLLNNYDAI